ncbi:Uncharacterised protein [uncultured Eubacterium sp.]|nr:Uncharacterised protein [uncultured Eubacterium sp.]
MVVNLGIDKEKVIARTFKIVFILMLCSSLLPWFDRGANAPLFWGFEVVMEHYLWIPFVVLILFIWAWGDKPKRWYAILGEAAFAGALGIYIYSVLYFKRYLWTIYEPDTAMDLHFGLSSAMITFWLSAFLAAAAFVLFQFYLYSKMKSEK